MKKDKTTLALIVAVGVFLLTSRRPAYQVPRSGSVPPPPPVTQPDYYTAFKNWAEAILQIFGDIKELWEPGGPFYGRSAAEQEAIRKAQEEWIRKKYDEIISNS